MCLKSAHYDTMKAMCFTDEEIEEDWKQVCTDLGIQHDEIREKCELPDENFLAEPNPF